MPSKKKTPSPKKAAAKQADDKLLVEPFGHSAWLEGLWRAAREGRLPHGLLVTGAEGTGRFTALRWLAAGLLCEQGPAAPCLACGPCKRLEARSHADLFLVDARAAGEDSLTIAFFAQRDGNASSGYRGPSVADFLELRAREGGWRIVLVREAERMNEAAQNAFLKTLEEPGQQTLIALESAWPGRLLDTVRSRVVQLRAPVPQPEDARRVLAQQGVEGARAYVLLRRAQGSPGGALQLAERGVPAMLDLLGGALEGRPAAQVRRELWEIEAEFEGKTPAAQSRARGAAFLDLGLSVLLDAERLAAGADQESLAFGDVASKLPALGPAARKRRLDPWLEARQDVTIHLSPDGLVDRALAGLQACSSSTPQRPRAARS